jgi:Icc-related predicted phosphoesterase
VIRVAAVGDIHVGEDSAGTLRPHFEVLPERADVLLLAGDLTRRGRPEEASVLADELRGLPERVPVVAVLGNHDYEVDREKEVVDILGEVGVTMLEGTSTVIEVGDSRVGIAGTKGFGGGFVGACASEFGEPEIKAFVAHTRCLSDRLEESLAGLDTDIKIALLHFSPVEQTLAGERLEIYPFLGSYLLAEAIDRAGADLAFHGHAHRGTEKGITPGGVRVRNVAQPVIGHAYNVYCLGTDDLSCPT